MSSYFSGPGTDPGFYTPPPAPPPSVPHAPPGLAVPISQPTLHPVHQDAIVHAIRRSFGAPPPNARLPRVVSPTGVPTRRSFARPFQPVLSPPPVSSIPPWRMFTNPIPYQPVLSPAVFGRPQYGVPSPQAPHLRV